MNVFKNIFSKKDKLPQRVTEKNTIYSPLAGTSIPLREIGDGVFSEEILGKGCGIIPSEEIVYAPFNGKVIQVIDTRHALGLCSDDGIELLIHIGMDTVSMNGNGFHTFVSEGDTFSCGQKLMQFSKKAIKSAGYSDTTAVIVTNTSSFSSIELCNESKINSLDRLLALKPK